MIKACKGGRHKGRIRTSESIDWAAFPMMASHQFAKLELKICLGSSSCSLCHKYSAAAAVRSSIPPRLEGCMARKQRQSRQARHTPMCLQQGTALLPRRHSCKFKY